VRARETLNLAARCRLVAGAVVFDLYGVLLDPEVMRREYHRRVAAILQREYGGTVEAWLRAHDIAYREYVAAVTRPGFFRDRPHRDALREAEVTHLRAMFREAGKRPPEGDPFALSEALDEIVLTGIHAAYPETARVLGEVRGMGFEVDIATNASLTSARAALRGSDLHREVHSLVTADLVGLRKDSAEFWRDGFQALRRDPWDCVVVDDEPASLRPAIRVGAQGVWVNRAGDVPGGLHFPVVSTLGSLRGLPDVLRQLR